MVVRGVGMGVGETGEGGRDCWKEGGSGGTIMVCALKGQADVKRQRVADQGPWAKHVSLSVSLVDLGMAE